jgi:hypothetical protein
MRLKSLFIAMFVVALATACGGDDDGGNPDSGGGTPDGGGGGTSDAGGGGGPDADINAPATGLGQVCNAQAACPAGADVCADLDSPQDQSGFCTLSCGTGPVVTDPANAMAPEGGDAICEGAYTAVDGTPACVLYSNGETEATWYCGVLCGMNGGNDFGECPGGLSCLPNNLCDD